MAGLENILDLAEAAKKTKQPKVSNAEKERQRAFLEQLRARKPVKVKAAKPSKKKAVKAKSKKGKKMRKAEEGETYYCTVCGGEVICTTSSESPLICCEEVLYILS